jgi:hypothetical protein
MNPFYSPSRRCVLKEISSFGSITFVLAKDLSIFVFYFILLKYNLTNETYSYEMVSNFPGAPEMTIPGMLGAALYITFLPLIIDLYVILRIRKFITRNARSTIFWSFLYGMLLHLPILIFWTVMNFRGGISFNIASKTGLLLSIPFAGLLWLMLSLKPAQKAA